MTSAQEHSDVSDFKGRSAERTAGDLRDEITNRIAALERIAADRPAPPPLALSIAEGIRTGLGVVLDEIAERASPAASPAPKTAPGGGVVPEQRP